MVKGSAVIVIAVLAATAPDLAAAQGRGRPAIRFAAMDRNNDRTITRAEWTGSDRSFAVHDWNSDGILSGDEVRFGAVRPPRPIDDRTFDSPDREYTFDDWTVRGFTALDHNRDGRITRNEWHFDRESFRRADHNGDGIVSRAEFLSEDQDDDREDRFDNLDLNGDNRLSRNEWHGTAERFAALDANRDGVITRVEMVGPSPPPELFSSVDVNRDRVITIDEWHWSRASFDARDVDRNGRLTREEFNGVATQRAPTAAFKAGQARGLIEGRQAGREDKQNTGVWDLEGQRELEQADSGYDASVGPRAEYQAGYREGFRRGYREGFGQK